jgi:hypothetical protein
MTVLKPEDILYENKPLDIFHSSWLEIALTNYKYKYNVSNALDGTMTLGELIRTYAKEELEKCIKVK